MNRNYQTKVIALDIFGTILSTRGEDFPARKGSIELLDRCKEKELIICTCSDANTLEIKKYLSRAKIDLDYFDDFFQMPRGRGDFTKQPKDFGRVLKHYQEAINLTPRELFVVGDRQERDIEPARALGCNTKLVPEYYDKIRGYDFDINSIIIP